MAAGDHISRILEFSLPGGVIDSYGLVGAYCACVSPEEAAELLLQSVTDRLDLRNALLRKVCVDVDVSYSKCHENLVEALISKFTSSDYRERQSLGYCLSTLADHAPANERRRIQRTFLTSKYVGVRRRAYKSITAESEVPFEEVQAAWQRFNDPECAWLMVKTFPADYLTTHRAALEGVLTEGWQFSRLYMRIAEVNPSVLESLKSKDEISYCYVLAKLKRPLSVPEAVQIADRASSDDRFGLLVWSLGQLGLWAVLEHIEKQLFAIQNRKIEALKAKHGI